MSDVMPVLARALDRLWRMPAGTSINVRARFEFKRHDCWIGAYWNDDPDYMPRSGNVWICLLPLLPLHIWWWPTDPEGVL